MKSYPYELPYYLDYRYNPPDRCFFNHSGRKPGPRPEWLTFDNFRDEMFKHVDNIADGRWEAVSTKDGIVWFRFKTLRDVIKKICNNDAAVMTIMDDEIMNALVFTVLKAFKEMCVYWGMLDHGEFWSKCRVINMDEKITETAYLTPVRTAFFNVMPSTLERNKPYKLRYSVAKIKPCDRKSNRSSHE